MIEPAIQSQNTLLEEPAWGRPVKAEIDLSAIASNVRAIKKVVGPRCRVVAVVKADGYGLGAPWVAAAALEGGASWLAVACVDEGVQLRRAGYTGPLLVMGYVPPDEAVAAVGNRLTLTLHGARSANALEEAAKQAGTGKVAVHIKVDTGLGRYGCLPEEFMPLMAEVASLPHLRVEGLMTHFADADSADPGYAHRQLALFNRLRTEAVGKGFSFEIVHAANSAAALALPEARFDMVRVGIMLSGHLPAQHLATRIDLTKALTLRSRLARVHLAHSGEPIGYGRTWTAQRATLVGLVPVGYADGYSRLLSDRGQVLVRGNRCPVIGRVSMDQLCIDVTSLPEPVEGEEVVLIGKQGEDEITADDLAKWQGTISYEVLCGLSERVPRYYLHGGEPIEVCNLLGCNPLREHKRSGKELSR